jgi:hypothetical protein
VNRSVQGWYSVSIFSINIYVHVHVLVIYSDFIYLKKLWCAIVENIKLLDKYFIFVKLILVQYWHCWTCKYLECLRFFVSILNVIILIKLNHKWQNTKYYVQKNGMLPHIKCFTISCATSYHIKQHEYSVNKTHR